jgi:hypothetical protein
MTAMERNRAHVDREPITRRVEEHDLHVGHQGGPRNLLGKRLAGTPRILGRDHRGELATANIPKAPLRRAVRPADDAGLVDHVARDVDALECTLYVAAQSTQARHAIESCTR